jgi:UDP-N-acetylmuramoylalanine-D-glutamate ligase
MKHYLVLLGTIGAIAFSGICVCNAQNETLSKVDDNTVEVTLKTPVSYEALKAEVDNWTAQVADLYRQKEAVVISYDTRIAQAQSNLDAAVAKLTFADSNQVKPKPVAEEVIPE